VCEAWNEVGEAKQSVRVTIKGNEYSSILMIQNMFIQNRKKR